MVFGKGDSRMKRIWTKDKVTFLKNNFDKLTDLQISKSLKLTESQVKDKRLRIGLKRERIGTWTQDEIEFLKENFLSMSVSDAAKALNRTENAVSIKAASLNICRVNRWTSIDDERLKRLYPVCSAESVAKELGRSKLSVMVRAHRLGVKGADPYQFLDKWTKEDDEILKRKFANTDIYTLSEKLDRSCAAIRRRAVKLGLSAGNGHIAGVHKPGEFNPFAGIL